MKRTFIIGLIILLAASALFACGRRRGGGGADPSARVTVNASKAVALANGSDVVTIRAAVLKADDTAVPDGTAVAFSSSNSACSLSAPTAVTTNGLASITLTHPAISGANNEIVTITGAAGSVSGTGDVRFINQPSSADVFVAFNRAVANLGSLEFTINNTAGASFDNAAQPIAPVNAAFGGTLLLGNFNAVSNSTRIDMINAAGFNTGTAPIIKATYSVAAGAGLSSFSVDAGTQIIATDKDGLAISPQVSSANLVVTTVFDTE